MSVRHLVHTVVLLWLVWATIILSFQTVVNNRFQPRRPDRVLDWTGWETGGKNALQGRPYLLGEFMDLQVAWDSEYYLSIAIKGYDDTDVFAIDQGEHEGLSLNYAFFPLYSLAIRLLAFFLQPLGLNSIATATLAGVLISLLGTLAGMFALYDIAQDKLGKDGALRAIFYMLIFPSGFFLAQVYTEGLFVGLAFGSLALLRRKHWLGASFIAFLAVWTRGIGIALLLPLSIAWFNEWLASGKKLDRQLVAKGFLALSPLIAYGIWSVTLGSSFGYVENDYFGRGIFVLERSLDRWGWAIRQLWEGDEQVAVYYAIELGSILLALLASLFTLRSYPGIALFSLAGLIIPLTSGEPQSMVRYVLVLPAVYLFLSKLGKHPIFDRVWSLASILLLGLLTTLFTFYFWVA